MAVPVPLAPRLERLRPGGPRTPQPARYVLLRLTPDPLRDEPRNIGLIVWSDEHLQVTVDRDALERAASENPRLAVGALHDLEAQIRRQLHAAQLSASSPGEAVASWLAHHHGPLLDTTSPRHTIVLGRQQHALAELCTQLLGRMVTPTVRPRGRLRSIEGRTSRARRAAA